MSEVQLSNLVSTGFFVGIAVLIAMFARNRYRSQFIYYRGEVLTTEGAMGGALFSFATESAGFVYRKSSWSNLWQIQRKRCVKIGNNYAHWYRWESATPEQATMIQKALDNRQKIAIRVD